MNQGKKQKNDIIVGIPTYNESDSVANVARKIDGGLVKYFPSRRALIVNIDSRSADGTRKVFLRTETKTKKLSLINRNRIRGKGSNIFLLLKLSKKTGAKRAAVAMIDGDITTITEEWPKLLLDPIIGREADFVTPLYTRDRYDGNITNHFCFPLLYAWFGSRINQPIGGDFAMSSRFINYALKQRKPESSFLYGIDIFLSTHAVGADFKTKEAYLGRKIHKPSFKKLASMFQQVAGSMFFVLSQYKKRGNVPKRVIAAKNERRTDLLLIRKPNRIEIARQKSRVFQNLRQLSLRDVKKYAGLNPETVKLMQKRRLLISEDEWAGILSTSLNYVINHKIGNREAARIAATLSPFFFLRMFSYFEELERNKKRGDIDTLIFNQAEKLKKLVSRTKNP